MRKQLMQDFVASKDAERFQGRIDEVVERYLDNQIRLSESTYPPRPPWTSTQAAYEQSLREMQRRPIVERTLEDVDKRMLPAFAADADKELLRIVQGNRKVAPQKEEPIPLFRPADDVKPIIPSGVVATGDSATS